MAKKLAAALFLLALLSQASWATDYDPYALQFWYTSPDYEARVYRAYGNTDYNFFYQLRDITGSSRTEQVGGPQWFATIYENYYYPVRNFLYNAASSTSTASWGIYRRTTGGELPDITFSTVGDLIDGFNFVFVEEPQPYASAWRRYIGTDTEIYDIYPDPVESLCLILNNGQGTLNVDFGNPYARHFPFWWNIGTGRTNDTTKWWQSGYDWRNETYQTAEPIAFICSSRVIYERNNNGRYEQAFNVVVSEDASGDSKILITDTSSNDIVYKLSGDVDITTARTTMHQICSSRDVVLYTVSDDRVYDADGNLAYTLESDGTGDIFICEVRNVNESVTVSGFDDSYNVTVRPTNEQAISSGHSLSANIQVRGLDAETYGSRLGYITFRQRASFAPGYTNYREFTSLPLVIANVSTGNASTNPLMFDMIVFDNDEVVNRIKFTWDAQSDNTGQDLGTFFMIGSMDKTYQLETRITNRTGTRYELYRYDMTGSRRGPEYRDGYASIMPDYWRYDLTPDLYGTLPDYFLLDAHSQIAPGLVTVYKNNIGSGYSTIDTRNDTSESFRLYEYSSSVPRNLRLNYKRVGGMTPIGTAQSPSAGVNVQEFSMQFVDVVMNDDETVHELENLMGKPPVMTAAGVSASAPSRTTTSHTTPVYINASAIDAFKFSKPVPAGLITYTIISEDDEASQDTPAPSPEPEPEPAPEAAAVTITLVSNEIALQPLSVRLRIPRQNQLIVNHWEELENASNAAALFNVFARYGTVWLRSYSTGERDANFFTALNNKGANAGVGASDCVRAFLYDDELVLDFIALLADGTSKTSGKTAYVEVFKDDDVPYALIGDGAEDGNWEMTFYVAAAGENPEVRSEDVTPTTSNDHSASPAESSGGGGGCESGLAGMLGLLVLAGVLVKRR